MLLLVAEVIVVVVSCRSNDDQLPLSDDTPESERAPLARYRSLRFLFGDFLLLAPLLVRPPLGERVGGGHVLLLLLKLRSIPSPPVSSSAAAASSVKSGGADGERRDPAPIATTDAVQLWPVSGGIANAPPVAVVEADVRL